MAHKVFFSFHFDNDVMRVQQIRNIGAIQGNTPVSPQKWEEAKRSNGGIEKWINDNMKDKSCVIVLIGSETSKRPWVKYEIEKAWNEGKGLIGIYIHNIKCARNGTCIKGNNPFDEFELTDGRKLSSLVKCYDPNPLYAYQDIADSIDTWTKDAIKARQE